ncbi:cutinase [Motilibacter rhizosphaerae]|uniref:Cutinase n=1 Tax=Motilibacter rhizosphaerae TaxID=598652 RepID=A0A4Q7NV69_9ACTN|nr:cutinase family protein [Motilibacter rhizosphaerae]RZS91146.1 cutinase [Motilibacter rhizosphaerae]
MYQQEGDTPADSRPVIPGLLARRRRRIKALGVVALFLATVGGLLLTHPADDPGDDTCPSVEIAFARGTGEPAGLGGVGSAFTSGLARLLEGKHVSAYAVNYTAAENQLGVGAGAADLVGHLKARADACPSTRFVLAGYSQGASVVDEALGIFGGSVDQQLPATLSSHVGAVVVFGNPLGLLGRTIETSSPVYGPLASSFCAAGDPVCGGGFDMRAHHIYLTNGDADAGAAAAFRHLKQHS